MNRRNTIANLVNRSRYIVNLKWTSIIIIFIASCLISSRVTVGDVLTEIWYPEPGLTVDDLKRSPYYPYRPDETYTYPSTNGPVNWYDNYGQRMRGYFTSPVSGDHTFWIASDDQSELLLSTDDDPSNAVRIASVDAWTNAYQFDLYPEQKSAPVRLVAGIKYYIEVLHKEGYGGDNVSVAVQPPGYTRGTIPQDWLSAYKRGATHPIPTQGYYIGLEEDKTQANQASTKLNFSPLAASATETVTISWQGDGVQYDVYVGDSKAAVEAADESSPEFQGTQTETSREIQIKEGQIFWRIDMRLADGSIVKGDVWMFNVLGPGRGLLHEIFFNANLEGPSLKALVTGVIDSYWGLRFGYAFSERYTGYILPEKSGTYIFSILSMGRVSVWLDGQLIIDRQTDPTTEEEELSAPIELVAGRAVSIRVEHRNADGVVSIRFFWEGQDIAKQIVPDSVVWQEPPAAPGSSENLDFEHPGKSSPKALPYESCPVECESEGVGDPIYAFSGEYYKSVVDLQIAGRGLDFIWARKYRSKIGPSTAQGSGWDFSYNIRIERDGDNLVLFDGNTRQDRYLSQPNGTWAADGFFQEVTQDNPDDPGSDYTLTFSDTSKWHFYRLDHPNTAGKISAISDRNGNTIKFDYDIQGRLATIHDALDTEAHNRDITIAYNSDGFIESVTDFVGRQARYEFYQDGDEGGSFGDLKSVTTPAVTGTPNGNDFPQGKTTVYTYSKGFTDERLNHNLLTITDPKGQTYLTNIYATTENTDDFSFDRVVRQIWGDPSDIFDLAYVPLTPSEENGFADVKAIVNDHVGNVTEYFFDEDNKLVVQREYTGRADPDQPTTETLNRTEGKLRPDDPDFFETRWIYNADFRVSQIDYPNGNSTINVYESDLNPSAPRRSRGNLLWVYQMSGPMKQLSDQTIIIEAYEYDTPMGGCCGTNFVTRAVDGRGNETFHDYDDRGNRLRTQHRISSIVEEWQYNEYGQITKHTLPDNGSGHHRVDIYEYYSSDSSNPNPQNGYLKSTIEDAENLALTTTYEYDVVGNVIRTTDPRGNNTQRVYNQLNQVVRSISRPVKSPSGVRYETDTYYDKNNNVVRVDIQNIDDQGVLQANSHFTRIYEYDILNYLIRQSVEVGNYTSNIPGPLELPTSTGLPQSEFITTEYEYDAKRNRTLVRYGEAVEGRQPTNIVRTLYDERDLAFRQIRAEGDLDQSTMQYDYDGNGNVKKRLEGIEGNPRTVINTYDGYNRLVSSTDPMGNVTTYHYDENGNGTSRRKDGELTDGPGGAENVRLSEKSYLYDAMDRLISSETAFFDADTQASIDDGLSVVTTEYSDTSQIIQITNDNGHTTETNYDTANRRSTVIDAKGNRIEYAYDENSNVISTTTVEKSDLGRPDEMFTTTFAYDSLNRLTQSIDNVGNTNSYFYDSRNNRTLTRDALDHETRFVYDGINRLLQTIRDLDDDGADGDGTDITTGQMWDDNSRLVARVDDNSNATRYMYDSLNRQIGVRYADDTQQTMRLDVHGNLTETIDGNGSKVTYSYDLLNRLTNKQIVPGPGVSDDTSFETYAYDGRSRLVRAEDDDSVVTRGYNSLSGVIRETLNGQTTACLYDGAGNQIECRYPGGRTVTSMFDELERKKTISDAGGMIATYDYIGPTRVQRREYGNGTQTEDTYDGITSIPNPTDDFGVKRIIATTHTRIADGAVIDARTYTWDPMGNKTQRMDIRADGPQLTHDYTYDAIYRLRNTNVTDGPGSIARQTDYDLDGVGNRIQVAGSPNPGTYAMEASEPIPADLQMNQYTKTPSDNRIYDENGNLVTVEAGSSTPKDLSFDYRDRLVEYSVSQRHVYGYDALGRRISRVGDTDGSLQETRYLYDGWQVIEEQDASGDTQATYVYGLYIDEVLNMRRDDRDYYYHTDDLYNVVALTDASGIPVERYEYADYGEATVLDASGNFIAAPSIGSPYLFQGRRLDPETGLYYFRNRYYSAETGRFIQRDSVWDPSNVGNSFSFVANGPTTWRDPFGRDRRLVFCGHTWIVVDIYNDDGKKIGERSLHFSPEGKYDWTINNTLDDFYPEAVELGRLVTTQEEDELLLYFWQYQHRNERAPGWNPIYNCVFVSLQFFEYGIDRPEPCPACSRSVNWCHSKPKHTCILHSHVPSETPEDQYSLFAFFDLSDSAEPTLPDLRDASDTTAHEFSDAEREAILNWINQVPLGQSAVPQTSGSQPGIEDRFLNCFVAGTPVLTERGQKPIEDVKRGERVMGWNEKTGRSELFLVAKLVRGIRDDLCRIEIADQNFLTCSRNHRFWVEGKGWIQAENLSAGLSLQSTRHRAVLIVGVESLNMKEPVHVYNLEVDSVHNYFAGNPGVLVHNWK